jgi:trans-aconitate methyltransferase
MSDEETLKVYADKVDDYAKLVTRGTPDRDLQDFIDGIPAGGRVLDLGCGPGNSAAMMLRPKW